MSRAVAHPVGSAARPGTGFYPFLVIVQAWAAMLLLINPLGNFPVLDDWAYRVSVSELVEHGRLVFHNWTATNLVSQVIWGALFALPFGGSYVTLRLSTEVLALAGAGALYLVLREIRCGRGTALLGALLFLFNPVVCMLSASFMSDVPYAAMQTIAMFWLIRSFRSGSNFDRRAGWGMSVLALLCRQTGMAIPIGFGAAKVVRSGFGGRSLMLAVLPLAAFVGIQLLFRSTLGYWHVLPADFGRQIDFIATNIRDSGLLMLAGNALLFAADWILFLGLTLLPLSLLVVAQATRSLPRGAAFLVWIWPCILAILIAWFGPRIDTWSHIKWSFQANDAGPVPVVPYFWTAMAAVAAFGGAMLVVALSVTTVALSRSFKKDRSGTAVFAAVTAIALAGSLIFLPRDKQYDRYAIPVIPCVIIFLGHALRSGGRTVSVLDSAMPRWAVFAVGAGFATLAFYSVLGTHDYLAEKRTQWAALQDLVQSGHVPAETIDAGWAYNGPTSYGIYGDPNQLNTWYKRQDYVVSSAPFPEQLRLIGIQPMQIWAFRRWAPWARPDGAIVVIRRDSPRAAG